MGRVTEWSDHSWSHGVCRVWAGSLATGGSFFLKVHSQERKFLQERLAYTEWTPRIPSATPCLLASSREHRALLMTCERGQLASTPRLAETELLAADRQAGAFLRALHDLPVTDCDPIPLPVALRQRLVSWCERARGCLEHETLDWVRRTFDPERWFAGQRRVPCHRDFQPRNWLVDSTAGSSPTVRFIDFEHAGLDTRWVDFLKLWDGPWLEHPDRERAFFRGYGSELDTEDRTRLTQLALLHGVATTAWGREHGDSVYEAHGRAILARLTRERASH